MPQKKTTLEVFLAEVAELVKSGTCIFHLLQLFSFLFFHKNSMSSFSDGCLAQSKGHPEHNP